MNRQIRALSLIGLSVILAFQQAATVLAQDGPPSKDRYIIVLKPAKNGVPELTDHDITAGGGKVEYKVPGRVQVTLPEQAVDAIRKHGAVKYIQKVILGPLPDASAPAELRLTPTTSSLRVAAEATPPAWKSGTYQYDASGNIYAIGGVTGDGSTVTHRYAYDELSRLKQSDTIAAATQTQTFTYDLYGNLIQRQIVGLDPVATPVETPNTNRLLAVSGHPYVYDAAGNLTADYNLAYAYDPFNMLREKDSGIYLSKSEYYIYTASDERIGVAYGHMSDSPTIWSIRDFSGNVLRQYESHDQQNGMAWLWVEDYVYRGGQLLAGERVPEEGGRRHFHLDHLGSPRLVTGQDSKEMSEHDYEPFGLESNPLYQETAGGFDREDPKRFTGHERDYAAPGDPPASTAYLDYMHARYYSPTAGRFFSTDPTIENVDPDDPQSWNRYSYTNGDPMNLIDPDGREPLDPTIAAIASLMNGQKAAFPIRVHPAGWLRSGMAATTIGHDVFLSTKPVGGGRIPWNDYKAVNYNAMLDMTHEYSHVLQAEQLTTLGFLLAYGGTLIETKGYDRTSYFEAPAYLVETKAGFVLKQNTQVTGDTAWTTVITHYDSNYFRTNFGALVGQGQLIESFMNGTVCIDGTCLPRNAGGLGRLGRWYP